MHKIKHLEPVSPSEIIVIALCLPLLALAWAASNLSEKLSALHSLH